MIAGFYNALGNNERCENNYASYVKLIEQFYLPLSLETSNAYFLVGLYYHELGVEYNHKAIACFSKSLAIRKH
jgi:hypothetical protein